VVIAGQVVPTNKNQIIYPGLSTVIHVIGNVLTVKCPNVII
jgi:hypothetical protein